MRSPRLHPLPEERESMWMLTIAPTIWAAHFLLSYLTAAIWCAKVASPDDPIVTARIAIGLYTVVALVGITIVGWIGARRHHHGAETTTHDLDTPGDRHRFLGFATLLLAGISAVATVFVALVAVVFSTCR